jgi:hypothetical protein
MALAGDSLRRNHMGAIGGEADPGIVSPSRLMIDA